IGEPRTGFEPNWTNNRDLKFKYLFINNVPIKLTLQIYHGFVDNRLKEMSTPFEMTVLKDDDITDCQIISISE
ncbi:hypothetical protein BLOT_005475, partial [Blomia tropicalis]